MLSVSAYEELAQLAYEREMDIRLAAALSEYASGERGADAETVFERLRNRKI